MNFNKSFFLKTFELVIFTYQDLLILRDINQTVIPKILKYIVKNGRKLLKIYNTKRTHIWIANKIQLTLVPLPRRTIIVII